METQSMQEALENIHNHQNSESDSHESEPEEEGHDTNSPNRLVLLSQRLTIFNYFGALNRLPVHVEHLSEEDEGELGMGKWQSPKTQVRGGVRHGTENELNGFNHLMDEGFSEATMAFNFLLFLKDVSDLLNVVLTNKAATLVLRLVNIFLLQELVFFILSFNLVEFSYVDVVFVTLEAGSVSDRLDTKHKWHANNCHNNKKTRDRVLRPEEDSLVLWSIVAHDLKEVVDHGSDNWRR